MSELLLGESRVKELDTLGKKIIDWALVGSTVTDESVENYPLAKFSTALCIVIAYLLFVLFGSIIGRLVPGKGIKLYGCAFLYNIIQMMLCSYMCLEAMLVASRNNYSLVCNEFNPKNPPLSKVLWLFYISKVLDFADTFFIIIGKKWKQLSFLHVYHHATIFLVYWLNLHVNYDGDVYLTIILNGLIHAVMYTYYFVSMHTRDIWWKKFLTMAQLIQFLCMNSQAIYIMLTPNCSQSPPRVTSLYFGYIFSLFVLFLQFYIGSYASKGGAVAKSKRA